MRYVLQLSQELEEHLRLGWQDTYTRYEIAGLPTFIREFVHTYFQHTCTTVCFDGWSEGVCYGDFYEDACWWCEGQGQDFEQLFIAVFNDLSTGLQMFIQVIEDVINSLREAGITELNDVLPDALVRILPPFAWYQTLADMFYQHLLQTKLDGQITNIVWHLDKHLAIVQTA